MSFNIKAVLDKIGDFFKDVIRIGDDVIKVVEEVKELTPTFKTELAAILNDLQPIATTLAPVIAAGGENFVLDISAVEPVVAYIQKTVSDFVAFLPTLQAAIDALEKAA